MVRRTDEGREEPSRLFLDPTTGEGGGGGDSQNNRGDRDGGHFQI